MSLITAREAAERFGVSYSTVKQWIYQGSIRTTRTRGGHHRVATAEVERLLADHPPLPNQRRRVPATAEPATVLALSTRNQLRGIVEEVRTDGILAQVRLRIGDNLLTAVITRDAVAALGLRRGQQAIALIKSTEVAIACEATPAGRPRRATSNARTRKTTKTRKAVAS